MKKALSFLAIALLCVSCAQPPKEHRVVVCVPVYGQSLALGEEAERLTDFDSLANYAEPAVADYKPTSTQAGRRNEVGRYPKYEYLHTVSYDQEHVLS